MINSLVEFWSDFTPKRDGLHLHEQDRIWFENNNPEVLGPQNVVRSFDQFLTGQRFEPTRKELHLSLLPAPYHGNIANARIIILLMNPGFVASDYYAEENKQFRAAVMSNLSQTNGDADFPFFGLNPSFAWSGGYQWAEPKLRPFAKAIHEKLKQRMAKVVTTKPWRAYRNR